MKKLMFVAAVAAMGAAFGSVCDPANQATGCRVYDFKASLKLVDGKTAGIQTGGFCGDKSSAYYRVKATRKVKGVFTECDPCLYTANGNVKTADAFLSGEAAGGSVLYVSTSASKYRAVFTGQQWDGALTDHYCFQILNWIGGSTFAKSKVAEAFAQIEFIELDQYNEYRAYTLFCAGFGARNGDQLKNLSGNVAGAVTAANWCGLATQCYEPCLETEYWNAQGTTWDQGAANNWQGLSANSPAYDAVCGTFSIKYNASKSKLADNDKLMVKTFGSNYEFMIPDQNKTVPAFPFAAATALQ